MSLQDKVIIITGANSGVGAAAAKLLDDVTMPNDPTFSAS